MCASSFFIQNNIQVVENVVASMCCEQYDIVDLRGKLNYNRQECNAL